MGFASLVGGELHVIMLLSVAGDQDTTTINIVQSNITLFSGLYDMRDPGLL
jgi:hypothetical protein